MGKELGEKLKGLALAVGIICIPIITLCFFASSLLGSLNLGCVKRYPSNDGDGVSYDAVGRSMVLNAAGSSTDVATGAVTYGNWYSTGLSVSANVQVHMQISGTVKLCKAKLPGYNPEQYSTSGGNFASTTNPVVIPNIGSGDFLTIVLDPKLGKWANIAQIDLNDQILVKIEPQYTSSVSYTSEITGNTINADCSAGKTSYSPVCGIYSAFSSESYTYAASCSMSAYSYPGGNNGFFWNVNTSSGSLLPAYSGSSSLASYSTSIGDLIPYSPYPICETSNNSTNFEGGNCNNIHPYDNTINPSTNYIGSRNDMLKSAYGNVCNNYCSCNTSDSCGSYVYEGAVSDYVCNSDPGGFCAIYGTTTNGCYHNNAANRCWGTNDGGARSGDCGAPHWEDLFSQSAPSTQGNGVVISNISVLTSPSLYANYSSSTPKTGFQSFNGHQSSFNFSPLATKFWYSANTATALFYRFDNSLQPTSASSIGNASSSRCTPGNNSGYCISSQPDNSGTILSISSAYSGLQYLQYRFLGNIYGSDSKNTGGYILKIQQDACVRYNGQDFMGGDNITRGGVKYLVLPAGQTPTANDIAGAEVMNFTKSSANEYKGQFSSDHDGFLWLIVNNASSDYQNSSGQYNLDVMTATPRSSFIRDVFTPLLTKIRSILMSASRNVFKNMTCYNLDDKSKCFDFFLYVRALMTLYVTIYAIMFTVGMAKVTAEDLVIRFIKLGFVAGLLNGQTFLFFQENVYPVVTLFTDQIISNIQGYDLYDSHKNVSNPFMFIDDLMTNIFLSKTLGLQYLALLSFGFAGVFYFFILFFFLIILLMTILRCIATYIMAFVATSFLLSLAPMFLTFILFEKTRSAFDAWVKALFRFMMEPIILLFGVIVLTRLFGMILDNILSYSVCWKCSIPFGIPFAGLLPIPGMAMEPSFCLYWWTPWGFDYRTSVLGMNFQYIALLGMISFCLYGYPKFAESLTQRLTNAPSGAASARGAGSGMADAMINASGLKKVMPNFQGIANRSLGLGLKGIALGGKFLRNKGKLPELDNIKSQVEEFTGSKNGGTFKNVGEKSASGVVVDSSGGKNATSLSGKDAAAPTPASDKTKTSAGGKNE